MKKLFTFMMALLAILLPIGHAQAQGSIEIPIGGTTTTTPQLTIKWEKLDSEAQATPWWLTMSPYGEAYTLQSENDPGIYAHWNVETTDLMWDAATAGKNAGVGTYPMFRLRNAATGLYLKQNSTSGLRAPWDKFWEFELRPTTDANEALLFALVPKAGFGDEGNTYPDGSYVLMTNTQVQGYAGSLGCAELNSAWVPLVTGRKYDDHDWATWDHNNVAVTCTKTDVEVVEDLAKLCEQLNGIVSTKLIKEGSQFQSWCSDWEEGSSFDALLDSDPGTFWHSSWHDGTVANHVHGFDVKFPNGLKAGTYKVWLQRRSTGTDDHVVAFSVYGTNDDNLMNAASETYGLDEGWTKIADLTLPWSEDVKEQYANEDLVLEAGYKYLRFYNEGTSGYDAANANRGFFHMGGFQIEKLPDYPKGNELGQYKASAVDALTAALHDPNMEYNINDLDGDRSDATAWRYITKLHAAYVDMLQSKNKPALNGYYRLVNDTQHFWDGDRWNGVKKAMCLRIEDGCHSLWWDDLDLDDMSQIWKITYNEATGKYDMYNLDSNYRIDTKYNYRGAWGEHIFLSPENDGQMDIEYVDSPEGKPVFHIKTSGQYYNQPVHTSNNLSMWWWYPDGCYDKYRVTTCAGYDRWFIEEVTDMDIEENYILKDGTHYTNNSPIYVQEFHYTRDFKNTELQAMYVPASLPVETFTNQGVNVYFLNDNHAYFDAYGNLESMTMEIVPVTSGTLLANTPYAIKSSETGVKDFVAHDVVIYPAEEKSVDCSSTTYKFTFTGTNQPISASVLRENEYYFFSGGSLKQIGTSTASLGAQRWYLNIESRGAQYSPKPAEVKVRILDDDDWDETGIQFAGEEVGKTSDIYDLSGRKLSAPTQSGVYIQNGKKYIVR